ncbi:MAG: hypothetical protein K2Z81_14210 [Cyanobacteria bacterium]|nr:hypothetical protein [Cyanobacteriota bacterium]
MYKKESLSKTQIVMMIIVSIAIIVISVPVLMIVSAVGITLTVTNRVKQQQVEYDKTHGGASKDGLSKLSLKEELECEKSRLRKDRKAQQATLDVMVLSKKTLGK